MKMGLWELLFGGGSLLTIIIVGLICGLISRAIAKGRGMVGGFWWGFFLWIIGIIVVAVKPNDKAKNEHNYYVPPTQSFASELEKLAELKERGIITQEEFEEKKKQLLGL